MRFSHPVYGDAVYTSLRGHNGRWIVRGGAFLTEVEEAIRSGLTDDEIRDKVYCGRQVDPEDLRAIRKKCGVRPAAEPTTDIL